MSGCKVPEMPSVVIFLHCAKKMAARTSLILKCPLNLSILRPYQNLKHSVGIRQYATSKLIKREDEPVKFTTSRAGKMSIAETTGLFEEKPEHKIKKYIILTSIGIFLFYFCVIREENDLDEIIAGNPNMKSKELELLDLKLKLSYCEKAHLPTANLKARIEEIEDQLRKPVFPK